MQYEHEKRLVIHQGFFSSPGRGYKRAETLNCATASHEAKRYATYCKACIL